MVKVSRYTHTYYLGDGVALYHSLRMKPVYLSVKAYEDLQEWLASPFCDNIMHAPEKIKNEVNTLVEFKILTQTDDEDDRVLQFVRSKIPSPAINVCYIILSEQCNLACKYCFLGNNDELKRKHFLSGNMSKEMADKAISFFIKQIKFSDIDFANNKPIIIFYGGEPLVNFSVLEYIAEKLNKMRDIEPCIKNIELSMVSNGILLTEDKIRRLQELKVGIAISIDGFSESANKMRVDTAGNPIFYKILEKLDLCKKMDVPISLSVTLSEETVKDHQTIRELLDKYDIKSFGFNIMMSSDTFRIPDSYNELAADYIIDEFLELRKKGIYEDRIMRKLKAFSKAQVYFSDCAATAGGQIVIAPNGQVGICHGCLFDKKYFVSNVDDYDFIAVNDPNYIEWSQLTPINKDECQKCPSLGICGGGCPINAMHLKKGNTIHSIDERFCVHSNKTLEFFIKDLYRILKERSIKNGE